MSDDNAVIALQRQEQEHWRSFDREWQSIKVTVESYHRRDKAFFARFFSSTVEEFREIKGRLQSAPVGGAISLQEAAYWNHLRERRDILGSMLKGMQWAATVRRIRGRLQRLSSDEDRISLAWDSIFKVYENAALAAGLRAADRARPEPERSAAALSLSGWATKDLALHRFPSLRAGVLVGEFPGTTAAGLGIVSVDDAVRAVAQQAPASAMLAWDRRTHGEPIAAFKARFSKTLRDQLPAPEPLSAEQKRERKDTTMAPPRRPAPKPLERLMADDLSPSQRVTISEPVSPEDVVLEAESALARNEAARELLERARLSPNEREVWMLGEVQGLKQREIAERVGRAIGTVGAEMKRAKDKIRRALLAQAS